MSELVPELLWRSLHMRSVSDVWSLPFLHHFLVCVGIVYTSWESAPGSVRARLWFGPGLGLFRQHRDARRRVTDMSPAAAFHAQLASIMEVLANTAVAEICELVDSGYAVLRLEISRGRKENEVLRRKLRLMELRAARANALRAAAAASGSASPAASARARAQLAAHHPGNEPRRNRPPGGTGAVVLSRVSPQDLSSDCGHETAQPVPAAAESTCLMTAVIKVEDEDEEESWARSEPDNGFCRANEGQETETNPPRLLPKRESSDEEHGSPQSWMSSEVSSTSTSLQKTLNTSQRPETDSYDCQLFGSRATQNPLSEDPGCSYVLNNGVSVLADSGGSSFTFTVTEASLSVAEHQQQPAAFTDTQQGTPSAADEHQSRKEVTGSQTTFIRRDGWRRQDGLNRAAAHSREDAGGKSFVCNCCGKTLACLKNLKTHMRVHTGEKPFVCALCGKRFSDSSNLKRHQSVHTGEKRYGCMHCGKRFAQSGSLKVHMTVHTDCKQFRCSYCGKTFISGSHLRRHVTVHAGEKRFSPTLP